MEHVAYHTMVHIVECLKPNLIVHDASHPIHTVYHITVKNMVGISICL